MRRSMHLILLILLTLPLLVACQAGSSGRATSTAGLGSPATATPSAARTPTSSASGTGSTSSKSVPEVVRSVQGAVVQIIAQGQGRSESGTGSGFIIDDQGHIITNNHVVEGASKLTVVLSDNRTAVAKVVGADPESDIAVLQISESNLSKVRLGDSYELQVGEQVVAIGSALGLPGGPTVTTGVVSAVNRAETEPNSNNGGGGTRLYGLIQTDAAVNPGNSGGPLLNMRGEVIGINTLGQRQTESGEPVQGINYAISINTAREVADEIIRTGSVTYPYIGIESQYLYPQTAVTQNLPDIPGQYVSEVLPDTPAAAAGLRRNDIITAINGRKITDESTFVRLLRRHEPGETITLTIRRDGKDLEVRVTLGKRPEDGNRGRDPGGPDEPGRPCPPGSPCEP